MTEKQKKQLITMSLVGAVLLAGIVAGFLVVQNQQFVQNRAQTPAPICTVANGRCILPVASGNEFSPYIIQVKEVGADGSQKIIATSPQNATSLNFSAAPFKRYICEVVSTADSTCKNSAEKSGPVCVNLQLSPAVTPVVTVRVSVTVTPTVTPVTTKITITSTPTATPTVTATPKVSTGTPGAGTGTATPGSATSTPGTATATATPGAATATAAARATATHAPTATAAAAATATKAASSTSAASTAIVTSGSATGTSSTSLPVSGTVHPAIILGIISLFIIVLGLVF